MKERRYPQGIHCDPAGNRRDREDSTRRRGYLQEIWCHLVGNRWDGNGSTNLQRYLQGIHRDFVGNCRKQHEAARVSTRNTLRIGGESATSCSRSKALKISIVRILDVGWNARETVEYIVLAGKISSIGAVQNVVY